MSKRLILLIIVLLLPITVFAKKEAFLVGVGKYRSSNIRELKGVEKDIEKMKSLLIKKGFHVRVLMNSQATLRNVINTLKSYKTLSPNDVFLFYDSSHGVQVPDTSGDEQDGLDEAYALYDTTVDEDGVANLDGILVDDELERYLSNISARKFIIADACHSGTMYKDIGGKIRTKGLNRSKRFVASRGILGKIKKVNNLVYLSASQAYELSIDTDDGGVFTEAVYSSISSNPNITFRDLQVQSANHIQDMCNKINQHGKRVDVFHPNLYVTDNRLLNQPIDGYLNINIYSNNHLVEEYLGELQNSNIGRLDINMPSRYEVNDEISLNINTNGKSGYLYILTSRDNSNEINVLYPNKFYRNVKYLYGNFQFPLPNEKFQFIATKNSNRPERTLVYAILSKE
ncbi:MAG TPA: hypothetical protein ENK76_06230, partial [Campylobacterales bacterium]|nr:hypothetical protein [Campylobacterales bacterium]